MKILPLPRCNKLSGRQELWDGEAKGAANREGGPAAAADLKEDSEGLMDDAMGSILTIVTLFLCCPLTLSYI